jgi:hypothetical protein
MAICDILTDYCPSGTRLSTKDLDKRSVPVPFPLSSTHSLCRYSRYKRNLESAMALPRLRYPITDEHHMNGLILLNKIAECRSISKVSIRRGHMIKGICSDLSKNEQKAEIMISNCFGMKDERNFDTISRLKYR